MKNKNAYHSDKMIKELLLDENNQDILKKVLETALNMHVLNVEKESKDGLNLINLQLQEPYSLYSSNFYKARMDLKVSKPYSAYSSTRYALEHYENHRIHSQHDYLQKILVFQIHFVWELPEEYNKKVKFEFALREEETNELRDKNSFMYVINMDKVMESWYKNDEENIKKDRYLIMLGLPLRDLKHLAKEDVFIEKYLNSLKSRINKK